MTGVCALLAATALTAAPARANDLDTLRQQADQHWTLLDSFCADCHNFEEWAGGVAFDIFGPEDVAAEAATFEEAVRKLRGRLMPPPGAAQPDQAAIDSFVEWMEAYLDASNPVHAAGYVPIHRLNRIEYAVAVKGLLDVDIDPGILPTEIEIHGFDNIAHALAVSPAFLDQYLGAARMVARLAVGDPEPRMSIEVYPVTSSAQGAYQPGFPLGTRGGVKFTHVFPVDGEYRLNVLDVDAGLYPRAMETQHTMVVLVGGEEVFRTDLGGEHDLALVDRTGPEGRAEIIERVSNIPFHVPAGPHEIIVTFIERSRAMSDDPHGGFGGGGGFGGRGARILDGVEVRGPYEITGLSLSPSRERIFICEPAAAPEERACAERIAENLARRAFRRPVTEDDVATLMPFYEAGRADGAGFNKGVEHLVAAVLASPDFLYRTITPPAELETESFVLSDLELASRLSFFLWSQGPDEALIQAAESGDLSRPDVMEAQVRRMLADPRAATLVDNFSLKWLNLGDLSVTDPNPRRFPGFNTALRNAFATELRLFLSSILLEERSIQDLLTADHTYVNEALARHYGMDDVFGAQFRRVTLEDDARHGLLGKAAFLLRTSYGDRTSPVLRGAWVLEKLMGTPPSPPPPNVETDLTIPEDQQQFTIRLLLEQHRAEPSCNACHGVIDPIGLALENFDVTGRWRDVDIFAGEPIDASTIMPDGTAIEGVSDLRRELASRPDHFAQAFTETLMMYALGRELQYYDMPEVRGIVRASAEDDYRLSAIALGIVNSNAFRRQLAPEHAPVQEAALNP